MKYNYLGRAGLQVSKLCLGTWNFGLHTEEQEAFRILDIAIDAGINFVDTANIYGGLLERGATEEILGRWFKQGDGRREKIILATKVSSPMLDSLDGPNDQRGLSAFKIRRHLEGSLKRLQTDYVELYQMHQVDRRTTWEEIWEAFQVYIQQGKIQYVGSCNFSGWELVKAQNKAKEKHMFGLASEQHLYNLCCRIPELELIPATQDQGIGLITYSPLDGGILGGKITGPRTSTRLERREKQLESFTKFSAFCAGIGESEASVAIAWILHQPVSSVIIGPRTEEQLYDCFHATNIVLDEEMLKRLDDIFPGPQGIAPQAYIW